LYEKALDIGRRLNDPDLIALTDTWKSLDLIEAGRVEEGFALVDEVSAAAVGGELGPFATGVVLCNAIAAYRDSGDFAGAGEWAERATRWCERQSIHGFPGICRVRRAEMMRLRGAWVDAEREARAAGEELEHFLVGYAADAYLELGEIRLRVGDPVGAETAFRHAHALGRDPQPGQALLLLARGETEPAARGLQRALENVNLTTIEHARLLEALAAAFERLGATPDLARAREKLAAIPGTQPVRTSRAFLFSDIVDSTRLAETVGDETWANLLRWHDAALRGLFLEHHGEEVDHAGDGFLVAFDSAAPAIACAVAVQRMLAVHRREHGFAPRIRIGVHTADAVRSGRAFRGSGVHEAARIAALAGADEILASREAAVAAGAQHGEVRTVELRGIAR